ncbi:MAG TPA: citramalate synthase [Planctomycetota bacterium]|nr:citramalate synthase [Planctomycetota bacterium]HRR82718.1 citramalate synthase [Planctomycetota bacterium]HRT95947.1 citramalate synthase [Planctomycetota bacterium]
MTERSRRVAIYDTTLRDGAQAEKVTFSLVDKVAIAHRLDEFGVDYIEGGYPLSNPKDSAFFDEIRKRPLRRAQVVAFGNTRRAKTSAERDEGLRTLVAAGTAVVAIVGKSWDLHVREVLRVPLEENLAMIADSVACLAAQGRRVFFDAEHFFDGFRHNRDYALACVRAAQEAGAETLVLCDTNGGSLTGDVREIVRQVRAVSRAELGIHVHNDAGLAVANTLAAVEEGAGQVQGTINGIGERCGNVDLCSVIPNLALKMGREVLVPGALSHLTHLSRFVYQVANLGLPLHQPYVGANAFAHKGGLHVDAMQKNALTYEHVDPKVVGNERRILISELSGTAAIMAKARKLDNRIDKATSRRILEAVQKLENEGYEFEAAEASFQLLVRKALGTHRTFFDLLGFRVIVEKRGGDRAPISEATVKLTVNGQPRLTVGEGDGPVHALDVALRAALDDFYPVLKGIRLVDYKVRIVNPKAATAARTCVVIESTDGEDVWGTVGVSDNIIEASWQALVDSIEFALLREAQGEEAAPER